MPIRPTVTPTVTLCAAVIAAVTLGACGGSTSAQSVPQLATDDSVVTGSTTAPTVPTRPSTRTEVPAGECGPSEDNCTPSAVMATVTRYYLAAGATRAEAACIVPVLAGDAHAVEEAFDEPTAKQNEDGLKCFASEARLKKVAYALRDWLVAHTPGAAIVP
jgi:hypothetical protein